MVEEKEVDTQDPYANGEHSKVADFFIGFGILLGVGLAFGFIIQIVTFLLGNIFSGSTSSMMIGPIGTLFLLGFILPIIVSLILANKYFPNRRLVRVGIWIGFLLPIILVLLLLGACLVAFGNLY